MKLEDLVKVGSLKSELEHAEDKIKWLQNTGLKKIVIEIDQDMPLYHDIRQLVITAYEQVLLDTKIKLKDLGVEVAVEIEGETR